MRDLFIGPLRHWLIFAATLAALWLMGATQFHISDFRIFLLVLIGLSIVVLGAIILTYRAGERITRAPLDGDD